MSSTCQKCHVAFVEDGRLFDSKARHLATPFCGRCHDVGATMEITPAEHAETAAQAIRNLNHTTISPGDRWTYPADAADVIGSLAHLARILPQAIEQATALVGWAADEDRLVHDSSIDLVDTHLVRVGACERDARSAAEALATALDALHEVLVPLGYQLAGEPVDD